MVARVVSSHSFNDDIHCQHWHSAGKEMMGTFIWTFVYWDGWTNIALPSGKYLSRFLCLIVCLSSFIKCLGQLSLLNSLLSTHLHETHPVTFDECVEKAHLELEMSAFKTQGQCKLNWERQSRALLMSLFYFSRLSFTLLFIILTKNIARGTTDPGYWVYNLTCLISQYLRL